MRYFFGIWSSSIFFLFFFSGSLWAIDCDPLFENNFSEAEVSQFISSAKKIYDDGLEVSATRNATFFANSLLPIAKQFSLSFPYLSFSQKQEVLYLAGLQKPFMIDTIDFTTGETSFWLQVFSKLMIRLDRNDNLIELERPGPDGRLLINKLYTAAYEVANRPEKHQSPELTDSVKLAIKSNLEKYERDRTFSNLKALVEDLRFMALLPREVVHDILYRILPPGGWFHVSYSQQDFPSYLLTHLMFLADTNDWLFQKKPTGEYLFINHLKEGIKSNKASTLTKSQLDELKQALINRFQIKQITKFDWMYPLLPLSKIARERIVKEVFGNIDMASLSYDLSDKMFLTMLLEKVGHRLYEKNPANNRFLLIELFERFSQVKSENRLRLPTKSELFYNKVIHHLQERDLKGLKEELLRSGVSDRLIHINFALIYGNKLASFTVANYDSEMSGINSIIDLLAINDVLFLKDQNQNFVFEQLLRLSHDE